jgi:hypothetical protein
MVLGQHRGPSWLYGTPPRYPNQISIIPQGGLDVCDDAHWLGVMKKVRALLTVLRRVQHVEELSGASDLDRFHPRGYMPFFNVLKGAQIPTESQYTAVPSLGFVSVCTGSPFGRLRACKNPPDGVGVLRLRMLSTSWKACCAQDDSFTILFHAARGALASVIYAERDQKPDLPPRPALRLPTGRSVG